MERSDALKIFGLQKEPTKKEIDKLYKTLAKKKHPDAHPNDPNAKYNFQELGDAYSILKQATKSVTFNVEKENQKEQEKIKNEKAYDEYVEIYNKYTQKANELKIALDGRYYAFANLANRGIISSYRYQELEKTIVEEYEVLEKNVNAYDNFVTYLQADSKNPLNASMLEKLKGKRGVLSSAEVSRERMKFAKEFHENYKNKLTEDNAYSVFQQFYKEMQDYFHTHFGKKLNLQVDVEKEKHSLDFYQELIEDLKEGKELYEMAKKEKYLELTEQFLKWNIDSNYFFSLRKLNGKPVTYDALTFKLLDDLLDTFKLMNKIEANLIGYSLEDYLKKYGKTIETVQKKELEFIFSELINMNYKTSIIQATLDAQDMMKK